MSGIVYHPPKALTKLILHFKGIHDSWDITCQKISDKLENEWGASHIYDIYKGRSPATPKFKDKINQLAYKTFNPERFWLSIHATSKEQKDRWKMVPMEKRSEALDELYVKWAKFNLPCDPDKPCGSIRPYGPQTTGYLDPCEVHKLFEEKEKQC